MFPEDKESISEKDLEKDIIRTMHLLRSHMNDEKSGFSNSIMWWIICTEVFDLTRSIPSLIPKYSQG